MADLNESKLLTKEEQMKREQAKQKLQQMAEAQNEFLEWNAERLGAIPRYVGSDEETKNSETNRKAQALYETKQNKKYGYTSITLDKDTGAIVLTAPEGILKDKDFQKYFPASTLKELSQAYQTNKDYKVTFNEYNQETGKTEEKQVTVPEYIEKMNDNLQAYTKNAYYAQVNRNLLKEKYGDKANLLTDTQMAVIYDSSSNVVQIPEYLRNAKYFEPIKNDIDENGYVSRDKFKEAFNLDNLSTEDIRNLRADLEGFIKGSSWSDTREFKDENGHYTYNKSNIDEVEKALALLNYIETNEPDGKWYQKAAVDFETYWKNFGYTFQDMFLKMTWVDTVGNVIDFGSEKLYGQGTGWRKWKEENEKAIDFFNTEQSIVRDCSQMIANLAQIEGFGLGIAAGAWASKGAGNAFKAVTGATKASKAAKAMEALENGERVLTASKAARAIEGAKAVMSSTMLAKAYNGAKILVKGMPLAKRIAFQAEVARVFAMEAHPLIGGTAKFLVGFLKDTLHDAILFDSGNMLEALASNDDETRQYWLNQMAENAAFYGPLEGGKNIVKHFSTPGTAKTGIGKVINAFVTKGANRFAAEGMQARKEFLDWIYEAEGGHKNYLDKKYKSLLNRDHPKNRKAARLAKKITALDQADEIMNARKALGNVDIEWDGFLKVSDKTEKELMEANLGVKAAEIAADIYNRQIDWKRQEMVGLTKDPATGKRAYINESLAKSAENSARKYVELAKAVKSANLGDLVKNSGLTQDVIDFMMGSANHKRMSAIAKAGGEHAKEAQKAADIISTDLKSLTEKLPQEVREKALAYIESSPFFYMELNQYGIAHNYLSKEDISGYVNKTWSEAGGYQPIITKEAEENFFIQSKDARYRATITQEMESLSYQVKAGQNYMDPEIVRQTRLNVAAKSAINRELLDNYNSRVGVSFEEVVSGEQTKFARDVERGRKDIDASVALCTSSMFTKDENFFSDFTFNKKNATASLGKARKLNGSQIEMVVGSMSDDDVNRALIDRDRLTKGAGPDAWTREIEDEESFKAFYDSLNKTGKAYVDEKCAEFAKGAGDVATYNNYLQVVSAYGDDFEKGVRRAELVGDDSFRNSTTAKMAYKDIKEGRTAFQNGYAVQKARANLRGINGVNADELAENLVGGYNSAIEEYLKNVKSNKAFQKAVEAYWSNYAEGAVPEAIIDFFALQQLKKGKNIKGFKENLNKRLDDFIEKNKKALFQGDYKGNADDQIKKYADEIFNDVLDDEMNAARQSIEAFGKAPIDAEEVWKRAKSINDEIKGLENQIDMGASDLDIIAYMDSQGRIAYAKVDSSFASLYNRRTHVPRAERNGLDYVNAISATVFRMGTTALNIASWGNQLLRDYGSALIMGGSWSTIKKAADGMTKVFGESVVEQLKNFDPEGYELKQVEAVLKRIDPEGKLHMDMNAAAISRELMIGAAKSPSSTETGLYRKLWDELRSEENAQLDKLDETLRDKIKKLNPDNLVNAKREEYLRNRVYANNLQQALTEGYTLKQARIYAEFAMNNATINFGRQLYHLQSIAESTPYFRAAINGTTSFWRMWSLDPVGVSGRIFGGLIVPTIALISHSMADEENRKVYESIPEWQKRESFVFVMNGEAMSLPFPQEMAAVVAPFRQFVEHLYGVDKASFAELAFNDVLGFAPVDLTGFSTVDFNRLQGDPTLADILGRGFSRMFSQMAPVPLKTLYMLTTEIDPYTGRRMSDAQLWYYDYGSDSAQLLDETQSSFAKTLANWGLLGKNSYVWSKVLNGIFGTTGVDVLDTMNALFLSENAGISAAAGTALNALNANVAKPFAAQTVTTDDAWYEAVRNLTMEKDSITKSKEWKELNSSLMNETDPEKRKQIISERQNLIDDYTVKVKETTQRLVNEYHGTFDRHKLAAVTQLLNFASDPTFQAGSQYSSDLARNATYEGRDLAHQMMAQMDLPMVTDMSVFGYMTLDKDGNPVMKYTEPLAILDAGNTFQNQANYHAANLKAIINKADLYNKHQEVQNQITAIRNRGNLSAEDYSEIDALQLHWNAELAKTIAPYVQEYSAEGALNNKTVRDVLYTYVEVPNYWEVNNKGRHPSLGSNGNAKAAYYESWLKTLFRINDPYKGQYGKDLK